MLKKIKRCFLLGRQAMTNLESILKIRDFTLPTKVHPVKTTIFPVVMYGCESWNSNTLATECKDLTHWKRSWWWERLKAEEEGHYRGWDGWMAPPTWWNEFEQPQGVGDGQGSLVCCSLGVTESDMTERLNWTDSPSGQISIWPDYNHCTPSVRAGDTSKLCSKQVSSPEA